MVYLPEDGRKNESMRVVNPRPLAAKVGSASLGILRRLKLDRIYTIPKFHRGHGGRGCRLHSSGSFFCDSSGSTAVIKSVPAHQWWQAGSKWNLASAEYRQLGS